MPANCKKKNKKLKIIKFCNFACTVLMCFVLITFKYIFYFIFILFIVNNPPKSLFAQLVLYVLL